MAYEMTLGDAYVNIIGNINPLQEAFQKSRILAQAFVGTLGNTLARGIAIAAAPIIAGLSINNVMKEWMGKEVVINDLALALRSAGASVDLYLPSFQAFADELQKTTIYSSEAIMSTMAHAQVMGIATKQLEATAKAAAGLSAKLGIGLSGAMQLLIRASHGSTQRLKMYGIELDKNASRQEKFVQLLKIGTDALPLAAGKVDTLSGRLTVMKNEFSDLQATIGRGLAEPLAANMDAMQKQVTAWGQMMEQMRVQGTFAGISAAASSVLSTLYTGLATIARVFWSLTTVILSPLENIIRGLVASFMLLTGAMEKAMGLRPNQSWDQLLKSASDIASGQTIKISNPIPGIMQDWRNQADFLDKVEIGFGNQGGRTTVGKKSPVQAAVEDKAGEVFSFADAWSRLQKAAAKDADSDNLKSIAASTATIAINTKPNGSSEPPVVGPPPLEQTPGGETYLPGATSSIESTTRMVKSLRASFAKV